MLIKTLLFFICLGNLLPPSFSYAKDNKLPDPLSLNQALLYANEHPRIQLDWQTNQKYPQFKTLYLNCHILAYSDGTAFNNERERLFSPLFSSKESVQLDILQRFFDVLLADMSTAFGNENMAGSFITLDRTKNRQELNSASELDVAKKDTAYQVIRQQRFASEANQRLTRSLLAQAINHPENLPPNLKALDKLPIIPKELPPLASLYANALNNNSALSKRLDKLKDKEQAILKMELRHYLLERLF